MTVERGCGRRVQGGIYAEVGLGPGGRPVEDFIIDPPAAIDFAKLGVSQRGVQVIDGNVVDWVGSSHYMNVADFVEEVRRFGASRRLPKTLDFSKLTRSSRLLLIHSRAQIENHADYYAAIGPYGGGPVGHSCPKELPAHQWEDDVSPDEMCAGLWWEDLDGYPFQRVQGTEREVDFIMPAFKYRGHTRPSGLIPRYAPAFFMSLPITNLAVIKAADNEHLDALAAASASELRVDLEDE